MKKWEIKRLPDAFQILIPQEDPYASYFQQVMDVGEEVVTACAEGWEPFAVVPGWVYLRRANVEQYVPEFIG